VSTNPAGEAYAALATALGLSCLFCGEEECNWEHMGWHEGVSYVICLPCSSQVWPQGVSAAKARERAIQVMAR
jgi:hypothetical protein